MSIAGLLGIGKQRILVQENLVSGIVTETKTCWRLKVNTKPVRTGSLDGAAFPHVISFRYSVDGTDYTGSAYVSWASRCPRAGERISVYVDGAKPSRCAVDL